MIKNFKMLKKTTIIRRIGNFSNLIISEKAA